MDKKGHFNINSLDSLHFISGLTQSLKLKQRGTEVKDKGPRNVRKTGGIDQVTKEG